MIYIPKTLIIFFLLEIFFFNKALANDSILIGAYYFPGWYNNSENWKHNNDLRNMFPERSPIIGWQDQENINFINQEIKWASDYKIDFFTFDWYWNIKDKYEYYSYAIQNFKKVNKGRMKFSIMWANHYDESYDSKNIDNYQVLIKYLKQNYFSDPNYLKTNTGKPVISMYSYPVLIRSLGKENTIKFINLLKTECNAFVIAVNNKKYSDDLNEIINLGFDAITGWNHLSVMSEDNYKISFYSTYKNMFEKRLNEIYNINKIPIYPSIIPGWDDRPWHTPPNFLILNNNPDDFKDLLVMSKTILEVKNDSFNLIMIESWNEFGEGSYIIPSQKWGFKFLEKIKEVKDNKY